MNFQKSNYFCDCFEFELNNSSRDNSIGKQMYINIYRERERYTEASREIEHRKTERERETAKNKQ